MTLVSPSPSGRPMDPPPLPRPEGSPTAHPTAGFALPMAILVLTLLAIVGAGAMTSAGLGRTSSRSIRASEEAFMAAEAGITRWLASWPSALVDTLSPGATMALGTTNLPGGAYYRAWVDRFDSGSGAPVFSLRVTGGTSGFGRGQRTLRTWRVRGSGLPAGILSKTKLDFSSGSYTDA